MRYQVMVGNVGTVLDTDNGFLANVEYGQWIKQSESNNGRGSGEPVTLMRDGEPKFEYLPPTLFFVEITDTFGGDANYSWVTRHVIRAKSARGCVNKLSRRSGLNWRNVGFDRYDSKSGATCAFISEYDGEDYRFETDDRT